MLGSKLKTREEFISKFIDSDLKNVIVIDLFSTNRIVLLFDKKVWKQFEYF